jgi:hypothetical protein
MPLLRSLPDRAARVAINMALLTELCADPSIVWNMRALARFGLAASVTLPGNKKGILSDAFVNC